MAPHAMNRHIANNNSILFNLQQNVFHHRQFATSQSLLNSSGDGQNTSSSSSSSSASDSSSEGSSAPITSYNPHTGEIIAEYNFMNQKATEICMSRSVDAFQDMRRFPMEKREAAVRELAALLREKKDEFAELMATEMGKPIQQGVGEILKCAECCEYFADNARDMLKEKIVKTDASVSKIIYQPRGPIFQIAPFNFPFWQVIRFVVPVLMAGNSALIRHSHSVPKCALAIAELFEQISLPENALQVLFVDNETVSKIIADPRVQGVAFTGSTEVGSVIAAQAGRNIKKHVLELGGSDPFIVLKDADMDLAISQGVASRILNNGQSCIGAKRFIIEEDIYDEFLERLKVKVEELKMGDPLQNNTNVGPLARGDLRNKLSVQVEDALEEGARLVTGGGIPSDDEFKTGFYYTPTVLADIGSGMRVFYEELFGPVISVIKCRDADHAIELANMNEYGLGGAVFSQDIEKATYVAEELQCGMAFVNGLTKSAPQLAFGGVKRSGYGKECGSEGLLEFVNQKAVW
eukprot:CAMPEP_0117454972 /NCGR_PEP_ID=MMETSP0759-20121206/11101_1 /TAXON_ID=63605 /ORGANISM="Percolomonas cosmopolitus, Strain WS" /LENGTH=520 /DNA_ID=CAMNT_0005248225 /DNA_START=204 /DNA_END=1763 /DNA_ORIENTATION=+